MALETWLIDTSAFTRLHQSPDFPRWAERIERGLVHVCTITLLEIGYVTRNGAHYEKVFSSPLVAGLIELSQSPASEKRARETQRALVAKGQHRAPSIPDLLVAALADVDGHTVLHLDKDFDLVAEVTGQKVESLVLV
ncbi:MAG: ribonuclease [Microbacteriaceae bacterium BACL25 MAG-120322-bin65]|jgi:predicted nucleic acid-binding protein|nr:MAG: ribonuclease [Microbacteriaceae bacterium BACL25 MAG-120322-bin65]HAA78984.1 VapC toxin family PIN domain ribonuclease [Microbacteriaceae bacterium]